MRDDAGTADLDREERQQKIRRVQNLVANANSETAAAVDQASELADDAHPVMRLRNTHDELCDAYGELRRAIDRTETVIDALADGHRDPTPRQTKSEHADRLKEQYDGPVLNLALMLLEHNRREWLHAKPETYGAQQVERHGLTKNQRIWLNELDGAWRAYDGE